MFSRLFAAKSAATPVEPPPRTPSPVSVSSTIVGIRASPKSPSSKAPAARSPSPVSNAEVVELIKSVPPKALYDFILARVSSPALTSDELSSISNFFLTPSGLTPPLVPPPRLHCARCHSGYFECENTTRSCVMPHDDESAVVEHVGRGKKGAEYETLWGCCGQTVDGDGADGPPVGWCYEGKHCSDRTLSKYRHDADKESDRLESCEQRRCFQKKRGHKRSAKEARNSDPISISSISAMSDNTVNEDEHGTAEEPERKRKKRKLA